MSHAHQNLSPPIDSPAGARAATRRVLIAAISPQEDALSRQLADPSVATAVDWDWLVERAATHRVAALVAARLGRVALTLPAPIRAQLDDVRYQAAERARTAHATLQGLAAALERERIPFLLIKGSLLAELVYRDPVARPFYDVDVVVRRTDLVAAEELVRSWGYSMSGTWPLLGRRPQPPVAVARAQDLARRFYLRVFHNLSYAPARGDQRRPIELHWTIVPRGRLRLRGEQLWQRTTRVTVAGIELQTLDPEATLIHLAVHALEGWFHGFRLLHLGDVAWTISRSAAPYHDLWQLADSWGAAYHLELALHLVDRLFRVPMARVLLGGRPPSVWLRTALRFAGSEAVLVDRNVGPADPWIRRFAVELGWGLAVGSLRAKVGFSIGRRIVKARWQVARMADKELREPRRVPVEPKERDG